MLRILLMAITFLAASLCTDANAQSASTLDDCSLATTSTTVYQRWRTTTNNGANKVAQSIRVFNLDCLSKIINIGFSFPSFPSIGSLIQAISGRLCQVILNSITVIDSESSGHPLSPQPPAIVNRRNHFASRFASYA